MSDRWFRGGDFEHASKRSDFDPVAEGKQYGLDPEVSKQIWARVRMELSDPSGVHVDEHRAQERFRERVKRVAARGGQLVPGPGKGTFVEASARGPGPVRDELADPVAGRTTQVLMDERRWERRMYSAEEPAIDAFPARAGDAAARALDAADGRDAARRAVGTAIARATSENEQAPTAPKIALQTLFGGVTIDKSAGARMRGVAAAATHAGHLPGTVVRDNALPAATAPQQPEPGPRAEEHLPAATLERMERAYGQRFDDVQIQRDSAEVPSGAQAFTRAHQIHLERGVDLESRRGELVVAHELAHVVQQRGGGERPERETSSSARRSTQRFSHPKGRSPRSRCARNPWLPTHSARNPITARPRRVRLYRAARLRARGLRGHARPRRTRCLPHRDRLRARRRRLRGLLREPRRVRHRVRPGRVAPRRGVVSPVQRLPAARRPPPVWALPRPRVLPLQARPRVPPLPAPRERRAPLLQRVRPPLPPAAPAPRPVVLPRPRLPAARPAPTARPRAPA